MHVARQQCRSAHIRQNRAELSTLLRRGDPIGVYDGDAPNLDPGEYDDLVVPLRDRLRPSPRMEALASALEQVLADDYGLLKVSKVDAFAATVARWGHGLTSAERLG